MPLIYARMGRRWRPLLLTSVAALLVALSIACSRETSETNKNNATSDPSETSARVASKSSTSSARPLDNTATAHRRDGLGGSGGGAMLPPTSLPMPPVTLGEPDPSGAASAFTRLDARPMKLADYHGQVVVLDFYATWCPPCREEVPHLVALQKRLGAEGLRIIGLNVGGPDDRPQVPGFVKEFKIQYELGYPAPAMTELYLSDNDTIPQTFVFDRRGRLLKRFIGYDDGMPTLLEGVVRQALDAPADSSTGMRRTRELA